MLSRVGELTRQHLGGSRVLLVADPGLLETPWVEIAAGSLAAAGFETVVDSGVEPNPRTTTAERLGARAREERLGVVVAVGGGSALDAAKAAAMLATNPRPVTELAGRERFSETPLPFVACPTTCGTGSEVTWVSVLSDPVAKRKISVKGHRMFPALALVDPDALSTLPSRLVAWTGVDALTHAIEATTCRVRNPISDALAEQAIGLLFEWLPRAVADPAGDREARGKVALGSTVAGMAFGNADVAAVHCLSEAIGGILDLPHGLLNATLLVPVLRDQLEVIQDRLGQLSTLRGCPAASATGSGFLDALEALLEVVGIPAFGSLGIDPARFEQVAREAAANGSNESCAKPMAAPDYRAFLSSLP